MSRLALIAYLAEALEDLDHMNIDREEWSHRFYMILRTARRYAEDLEDQEAGI